MTHNWRVVRFPQLRVGGAHQQKRNLSPRRAPIAKTKWRGLPKRIRSPPDRLRANLVFASKVVRPRYPPFIKGDLCRGASQQRRPCPQIERTAFPPAELYADGWPANVNYFTVSC